MRHIFFISIFFIAFINSYGQEWTAQIDSVLTIVSENQLFDGQLLIAEKGKLRFYNAYGKDENDNQITKETSLDIASVSKAFTAVAILMLVDRGHIKLDNKLTDYFPKLPYQHVTIESLLNMTSGLPRFQPTVATYQDSTKVYTSNEIIKLVAKYKPENTIKGDKFGYNGDNYMLLAAIVEQVSRAPFVVFIKHNIFEPLGMVNSFVYNKEQAINGMPLSVNVGPPLGEGHIHSTAYDLYLFDQALYTNQLLSQEVLKRSFEMTPLNDGSLSDYGFAWRLHKTDNVNEAYIVGDGESKRSSLQRYMNTKKTFIYLHNVSGSNWKGVYGAVRNIWEGKPFKIPEKRTVYNIDTSLYKNYVGTYLSKGFGLLHITEEGNKLYLRPDPIDGKEELVPSSNTTFYFAEQALEWEFFLDEKGNVKGLGLKGKPETIGLKQ
ncbi:serine hydrolase [Flavivirga sp. 57AJ16]|uniref:serine hydrolase n=1 Tax=Flavivirga sp. 57AJ16 TaxID=3025307 RepID=UPI0023673AEB|nr:serine hydrolase [Flavivirga sp. 57AJ16]MDD7886011.1 serine hydrolase [Flavivirga sp. 57AJ16]